MPPKIDFVGPSTRVDVSKGASIKLECRAVGNPVPKIVWTRKVWTNSFYKFMGWILN